MADKRYANVEVKTDKPVAVDSPDHICPVGAANDNHSHQGYIDEVVSYFAGKQMNVMDLGCAGGQLAVDFYHRGHFSIGLEGSSFPKENERFNWSRHAGTVLHNADLTEPYEIYRDGERVLFDCISAWEVVEHIHPDKLQVFFDNIESNLKPDGIFVASINISPDDRTLPSGEVLHLHQSVFPEDHWRNVILSDRDIIPYPFKNAVRVCKESFNICLKRKTNE